MGVRGHLVAPPLTLITPLPFQQTWLLAPRPLPSATALAWQAQLNRAVDSAQAARANNQVLLALYGADAAVADSVQAALAQKGIFGINRKVVDLTLDGNIRLELRADRLKNLRCTPASLSDPNSGCKGDINGPRLENQMSIRSGGVIGQRLRINVDWDTQRDYTNSNIIQVYYEGLEDEFVRRIEVGSVAFRPPPSRFLTASIPTNNFGINAQFEVGQPRSRRSRPRRRVLRSVSASSPSGRPPPRRRTGRSATWTSSMGGSTGRSIRACCRSSPTSMP